MLSLRRLERAPQSRPAPGGLYMIGRSDCAPTFAGQKLGLSTGHRRCRFKISRRADPHLISRNSAWNSEVDVYRFAFLQDNVATILMSKPLIGRRDCNVLPCDGPRMHNELVDVRNFRLLLTDSEHSIETMNGQFSDSLQSLRFMSPKDTSLPEPFVIRIAAAIKRMDMSLSRAR